VGYTVDVIASPKAGGWLRAQVASFEPRTRKHLLLYPRAGEEWVDLQRADVRVVAATVSVRIPAPPPSEIKPSARRAGAAASRPRHLC
jgi:hypothetical protein